MCMAVLGLRVRTILDIRYALDMAFETAHLIVVGILFGGGERAVRIAKKII